MKKKRGRRAEGVKHEFAVEEMQFGVGVMALLELFSFGQCVLAPGQPISYMCTFVCLITRACSQP